jgi:hypothetical protein
MSRSSSQGRKRSYGSEQSGTTKTSKSSAYSSNFEQKLIDRGIYPKGYEFQNNRTPPTPMNLEDIRRRLTQPRPSLSPSQFLESDFNNFERHNDRARTEPNAMAKVVPIIAGDSDDRYPSQADVPFGHLELMDKDLVKPKPDLYYGAKPEQIDRQVRDELGKYIVPSSDTSLPAVPNYFLEGKSTKGRADVAVRQACYDGAVGARAMHQLQNYGASTPVYDGNAYTIASTYHDGQLKMYAIHPTEPKVPGTQPEYYMTQLNAYALGGTADRFREGAGAYRNARDWAKEQRDQFIADANGTAQRRSAELTSPSTVENSRTSLSTVAEADFADSDTSADELSLDNELINKRPRRASPANQNSYQCSMRRVRHDRPFRTKTSQMEQESQLRSHTRYLNPAERDRLDEPRPNTRSRHVVDESPMNVPSGPGGQAQRKQGPCQNPISAQMRSMTEVHSEQTVRRGRSGRQIRYNGRAVFVARDRWTSFSRDSREGLCCEELNVYTYLT